MGSHIPIKGCEKYRAGLSDSGASTFPYGEKDGAQTFFQEKIDGASTFFEGKMWILYFLRVYVTGGQALFFRKK